jgi:hypothetical protein
MHGTLESGPQPSLFDLQCEAAKSIPRDEEGYVWNKDWGKTSADAKHLVDRLIYDNLKVGRQAIIDELKLKRGYAEPYKQSQLVGTYVERGEFSRVENPGIEQVTIDLLAPDMRNASGHYSQGKTGILAPRYNSNTPKIEMVREYHPLEWSAGFADIESYLPDMICHAAVKYDQKRGSWVGFLRRFVRSRVRELRRNTNLVGETEGTDQLFEPVDVLGTLSDVALNNLRVAKEKIDAYLARGKNGANKKILRGLLRGKSQKAIAKKLGISAPAVSLRVDGLRRDMPFLDACIKYCKQCTKGGSNLFLKNLNRISSDGDIDPFANYDPLDDHELEAEGQQPVADIRGKIRNRSVPVIRGKGRVPWSFRPRPETPARPKGIRDLRRGNAPKMVASDHLGLHRHRGVLWPMTYVHADRPGPVLSVPPSGTEYLPKLPESERPLIKTSLGPGHSENRRCPEWPIQNIAAVSLERLNFFPYTDAAFSFQWDDRLRAFFYSRLPGSGQPRPKDRLLHSDAGPPWSGDVPTMRITYIYDQVSSGDYPID